MSEHISKLKFDPKNARKHTPRGIGTIERSLQRDGFGRSILLANDGTIIAGNATTEAATNAGIENVRIIESDGTEIIAVKRTDIEPGSAEFVSLAVADNRAGEHSSFDPEVLQALIADEKLDADEFWFPEELAEVLAGDGDDEPMCGNTDPDDVPDVPEEPTTKPGDLWQMGRHRLLCGDSTNVTDVDRLMDGVKADMVFTDPPYGIDVVQSEQVGGGGALKFGGKEGKYVKSSTYKPIENDSTTDVARDAYATCVALGFDNIIMWGGNYFTDFLPPSPCWIIWDKENTGNFADVEMAWTSFGKGAKLYRWLWNGLARKGDRDSELTTRVHPTQKPVGLFVDIFRDFPGDLVVDLFGGSGSTLIACEQTNRTAYLMELDPHYCDVIVRRWENFTGQTATLITDETPMSVENPHVTP